MILYHIGHYGAFVKGLFIHFSYHKGEKACFLLDNLWFSKEALNFMPTLKKNISFFADLVLYSDSEFKNEESLESAENHIQSFFDGLLKDNNININQCSKIYSMFDTFNAFGVYLDMNNLNVTMVDWANMFIHNRYCINDKKLWENYDKCIEKHKSLAFGNVSPNVKILYHKAAPLKDENEKTIEFELLLNNLDKNSRKEVLNIFNFEESEQRQLCKILSFSSGWICGERHFDKKKYFEYYQMMLDFMSSDNYRLLLKPHPNYPVTEDEAREFFPGATLIPCYVPYDIFPLMDSWQIDTILSTSSGVPQNIFGSKVLVAIEIFDCEAVVKRLYFAFKLEERLQPKYNTFYHFGMHNKIIWWIQDNVFGGKNLRSIWANLHESKDGSITIVDNFEWNRKEDRDVLLTTLKNYTSNGMFIFLNTNGGFKQMLNEEPLLNDYVVRLRFLSTPVKTIEELYVFCKDPGTLEVVRNFKFHEYFQYEKVVYETV